MIPFSVILVVAMVVSATCGFYCTRRRRVVATEHGSELPAAGEGATGPLRLVVRGRLNEPLAAGVWSRSLTAVRAILPAGLRGWQNRRVSALTVTTKAFALHVQLADFGVFGVASVLLYDMSVESGARCRQLTVTKLLSRSITLPDLAAGFGRFVFSSPRLQLSFLEVHEPQTPGAVRTRVRLRCSPFPDESGRKLVLEADLFVRRPPAHESLLCVTTPWARTGCCGLGLSAAPGAGDRAIFNCAARTLCLQVWGSLRAGERQFRLPEPAAWLDSAAAAAALEDSGADAKLSAPGPRDNGSFACFEFARGVWPLRTHWLRAVCSGFGWQRNKPVELRGGGERGRASGNEQTHGQAPTRVLVGLSLGDPGSAAAGESFVSINGRTLRLPARALQWPRARDADPSLPVRIRTTLAVLPAALHSSTADVDRADEELKNGAGSSSRGSVRKRGGGRPGASSVDPGASAEASESSASASAADSSASAPASHGGAWLDVTFTPLMQHRSSAAPLPARLLCGAATVRTRRSFGRFTGWVGVPADSVPLLQTTAAGGAAAGAGGRGSGAASAAGAAGSGSEDASSRAAMMVDLRGVFGWIEQVDARV